MEHCPQTGKIYVLIIICLVFSSLLTSINIVSKTETTSIDDKLFGPGITINIIQTLFTIYLVGIDMFGSCSGKSQIECGKGCKWFKVAPSISKCTKIDAVKGYIYIPIILLSSAYMISFGIINIIDSNDLNDEEQITTLSIASLIIGVVGMLYIFSELVCSISCDW